MSIFIQSLIYIISVIGIFVIYFVFTDKDYDIITNSKDDSKKGKRVMNIYTYNIYDEDIKVFANILSNDEKLNDMVDIVNIYQKFDK